MLPRARKPSRVQKRGKDWRSSATTRADQSKKQRFEIPVNSIAAGITVTTAPKEAVEAEHRKSRYTRVLPLQNKEEPLPAPTADGGGMLFTVSYVSMAEKIVSGKAGRCRVAYIPICVRILPGNPNEPCMLLAVLNSGSGKPMTREKRLQFMQETWPDV